MNFLQIFLKRFSTNVFLVEINYKSGISRRFCVSELKVQGTSRIEWSSICDDRPILMNFDNVESVWQVKSWTKFNLGLNK